MATAPLKSQPLHNFSLPHLRWAHKTHPPPPPPPHSTHHPDSPQFHLPNDVAKPSSRTPPKPPPLFPSLTACSSADQRNYNNNDDGDVVVEVGEKPWSLRPRKVVTFPSSTSPTTSSFRKRDESSRGSSYSRNNNNSNESGLLKRKVVEEKRKLWISLSKQEIEEDVYSLTGSRPSRRPKKRPRTLQKHLDNVFPGLYLVGMSVDSLR